MTEIEFEEIPEKKIDIPSDSSEKEMRDASIKKLEKSQMDKQVRAEAGITEIPKEPEQIPKELPKYLFKLGSNAISCPKFQLDDEESKLLAKHISILTGNINSKIFSLIIIIIVVISKITTCWEAIQMKFGKKKKEEGKDTQKISDEMKNSEVSG